jgi:hypothetical protein
MVRRGSTVRVRQRALQKRRKSMLSPSGRLAVRRSCGGYGAVYGAFAFRAASRGARLADQEADSGPFNPRSQVRFPARPIQRLRRDSIPLNHAESVAPVASLTTARAGPVPDHELSSRPSPIHARARACPGCSTRADAARPGVTIGRCRTRDKMASLGHREGCVWQGTRLVPTTDHQAPRKHTGRRRLR